MINQDLQWKLQAYLDDELSPGEAAQIKGVIDRDLEARALFEELRNTSAALAGNEFPCPLPESREFFWSKIERELGRQSNRPARETSRVSWVEWVQRHLVPVSGVALLACLLGISAMRSGGGTAGEFGETQLASEDMGAYTYRDQQDETTMVWVYDRSADSEFTEAALPVSLARK